MGNARHSFLESLHCTYRLIKRNRDKKKIATSKLKAKRQ